MKRASEQYTENGMLKSLLLNQALPSNLLQQENVTDVARMLNLFAQQNVNEIKNQNDMWRALESYRNLLPIMKQPLDQIYPISNNGMFNIFPQFQAHLPFMSAFPLNLCGKQPFHINQNMKPITEDVADKYMKPKNLFLKRHYDEMNNSTTIKEEMTTESANLDVGFDINAPFGRSKSGKPLKRPSFVPSYMENGSGPFLCVVCDKEASGLHYKAMTCEGCKGFFRRTIQQYLAYDCKFGGQCDVSRKVKKDVCRKCRWDKCLSMGMAKSSVLSEDERRSKNDLIKSNKLKRVLPVQDNNTLSVGNDLSQTDSVKSESESNRDEETSFVSDGSLNLKNLEIAGWINQMAVVYQTGISNGKVNIRYFIDNLPGFEKISKSAKRDLLINRGVQCALLLFVFKLSDNGSLPVDRAHLTNSADNFNSKLWIIAEKIDKFNLSQSERCLLFALILLANYTHVLSAIKDDLDDLETKYLTALDFIIADSTRRGKILLFVFPELAKLSDEFINCSSIGNDGPLVCLRDQLHDVIHDMSADSYHEIYDDEPLPLVIKVD